MTARKPAKTRLPQPLEEIEWDATLNGARLPSAWVCQYLIDHPYQIARPEWRDVLIRVLRQYNIDHPPKKPSGADVAHYVDWLIGDWLGLIEAHPELFPWPLRQVRRMAAEELGLSFRAVKDSHVRYGKRTLPSRRRPSRRPQEAKRKRSK